MNEQAIVGALKATLPFVELLTAHPLGADWAQPGSDREIVWRLTDVGIQDVQRFRDFVATLQAEPKLGSIEGKLLADSLGSFIGHPMWIQHIAKSLLAQTLNGRDADEVVHSLSDFLEGNRAETLVIVAISGIDVKERVPLANGLELWPIDALPVSIPRGIASGRRTVVRPVENNFSFRSTTAIVGRCIASPIIVSRGEHESAGKPHLDGYNQKLGYILETLNLLSLIDLQPIIRRIGWQHFIDPGAFFLDSSSWESWDLQTMVANRELDVGQAQRLCSDYFRIPDARRERALRVPLDRLTRAIRGASLIDRAIDLGIALEALLLHDISDNRELGFRLRLRGALLLEAKPAARRAQIELLKQIYSLRSKAVHKGRLKGTEKEVAAFRAGLKICAQLIRAVIDKGGRIDFEDLELGGGP